MPHVIIVIGEDGTISADGPFYSESAAEKYQEKWLQDIDDAQVTITSINRLK